MASRILVVDDEKNIRLTVPQALEPLGASVETAVNGEEALEKLAATPFDLVLLDLKMPGIDGMAVLRTIAQERPRTHVIIITAHGTVASAVEAMKLGAVDYIQKPFSPAEIRGLVARVIAREHAAERGGDAYEARIEVAKRHITDRDFPLAEEAVRGAIAADPAQPEAYNLLGALREIQGDWLEALKFYRAALDIDPTYRPAAANIDRVASRQRSGTIDLGAQEAPASTGDEGAAGTRDGR